ncbi:cytochrome P460 family protein [Aquimarina sediminis]|uniref:cytochrome P460 family protein n=1 Tax=Aquimarina sediminis TaxID=2070536 RepID=UPI000CA05495|nr:cytochrome P460 family protein [Aquimarina sediminis]
MNSKINLLLLLIVTLLVASCKDNKASNEIASTTNNDDYKNKVFFTMENGELLRPKGYRTWVFVGTPVTPNDLNGGLAPFPEMHNVYIDPVSFEHYKQTGKFRENTILIKELVSVGATVAASGNGYFEGEYIGLEASIKSKEHFPDEPGNWSIFSFTQPKLGTLKERSKPFPYEKCAQCHDVSAQDDFVFTQFYPVLRAAKNAGDAIPENSAKRTASEGSFTEDAEQEREKEEENVMAGMMAAPGVWDPQVPTPTDKKFDIPLEKEKLFAYLNTEKYKSLKYREDETPHRSAGPHEFVRSFFSDNLAESVKAGNSEHPIGSYAIKEMYKDGKQYGWAVMLKTQESSDKGNGWFWYEVTDRNDISKEQTYGNGVKGCVSCHAIGKDMVRASFL